MTNTLFRFLQLVSLEVPEETLAQEAQTLFFIQPCMLTHRGWNAEVIEHLFLRRNSNPLYYQLYYCHSMLLL